MFEIINGIKQYLIIIISKKNESDQVKQAMVKQIHEVFDYIIDLVGIRDCLNEPLKVSVNQQGQPIKKGLWDA